MRSFPKLPERLAALLENSHYSNDITKVPRGLQGAEKIAHEAKWRLRMGGLSG